MKTLAFIEQRGGHLKQSSLEVLVAAKKLGGSFDAIIVGSNIEGLTAAVGKFGPDKILLADDAKLAQYNPVAYAEALAHAAADYDAVLAMASPMGKDLMARA